MTTLYFENNNRRALEVRLTQMAKEMLDLVDAVRSSGVQPGMAVVAILGGQVRIERYGEAQEVVQ